VGGVSGNNRYGNLALTEQGGKWTSALVPQPTGAAGGSVILAESGSAWTAAVASAPPGATTTPDLALTAVSCPLGGNCTIVGTYRSLPNGYMQAAAYSQTGGGWQISDLPFPPGAGGFEVTWLPAVQCSSSTSCTAAGHFDTTTAGAYGLVLVETASGWTALETDPLLDDVSCTAPSPCTAIGTVSGTGTPAVVSGAAVTETGDMLSAVETPLPSNATAGEQLSGVACVAPPGGCVADGTAQESGQSSVPALLTEVGRTWSAVTAPAATGSSAETVGPSACSTSGVCLVIGAESDPFIMDEMEGLVEATQLAT
jgi:hypothetical protein